MGHITLFTKFYLMIRSAVQEVKGRAWKSVEVRVQMLCHGGQNNKRGITSAHT